MVSNRTYNGKLINSGIMYHNLWGDVMSTTGERIAEKRQENGWSQTKLARLAKVSLNSVKDWENRVSLPAARTLIKLSELFGVSTDYLLCLDHRTTVFLDNLSFDDQIRVKAYVQMLLNLDLPSSK